MSATETARPRQATRHEMLMRRARDAMSVGRLVDVQFHLDDEVTVVRWHTPLGDVSHTGITTRGGFFIAYGRIGSLQVLDGAGRAA